MFNPDISPVILPKTSGHGSLLYPILVIMRNYHVAVCSIAKRSQRYLAVATLSKLCTTRWVARLLYKARNTSVVVWHCLPLHHNPCMSPVQMLAKADPAQYLRPDGIRPSVQQGDCCPLNWQLLSIGSSRCLSNHLLPSCVFTGDARD